MSLAAGAGSVITEERMVSTQCRKVGCKNRHCNGIDYWIITGSTNTPNFRCFLLTSTGVSTAVVTSTAQTTTNGFQGSVGYLKVSPNGRKLANAAWGNNIMYEIYDFDNSTGLITNPISLGVGNSTGYGCEFSPDGTKFYGGVYSAGTVFQWDLCAGSPTAIAASQFTVQGSSTAKGAYQLAADGKIYISRISQQTLAVINNPNVAGSGCGYMIGQSISPRISSYGLPNIITSGLKPIPPPFTHTVNNLYGCQTASFNAPPSINNFTVNNCVGFRLFAYGHAMELW